MSTRPRRRFGQHFLHDPAIIERIVDWIAPRPGQSLLEIGPGPGALTGRVLARAGRLAVIEIDRDLAAALRERWPESELRIIREGGHSPFEPAMADALVHATNDMLEWLTNKSA